MATIQKLQRSKGNVYRVLIRKKNFKTITKVFHAKKEAIAFSQEIEGSRKKHLSYTSIESSNLTFNELVSAYLLTENKSLQGYPAVYSNPSLALYDISKP